MYQPRNLRAAALLFVPLLFFAGCSSPMTLAAGSIADNLVSEAPGPMEEPSAPSRSAPPSDAAQNGDQAGPDPAEDASLTCPPMGARNLQVGRRGELVRGDADVAQIALTFDAGAGSGSIHELLDVLREHDVRSTFFIAGAFADRYPQIVERMAAEGHELANHSYSHPDFRNLTERQMRDEIQRGTVAIERAAGAPIAPLWRPPYGGRDDRVLRVVEEEGFRSIFWTFDSGDWIVGATTRQVVTTDLSKAVNGAVVVHHVSPEATARAMPTVIDELRQQGFELVTVSEILGYDRACFPRLE